MDAEKCLTSIFGAFRNLTFMVAEILDFKKVAFVFIEQWVRRIFGSISVALLALDSFTHHHLFNLYLISLVDSCRILTSSLTSKSSLGVITDAAVTFSYIRIEDMVCNMCYVIWFLAFHSIYCFLPKGDLCWFCCISYDDLSCHFHSISSTNFCFRCCEFKISSVASWSWTLFLRHLSTSAILFPMEITNHYFCICKKK